MKGNKGVNLVQILVVGTLVGLLGAAAQRTLVQFVRGTASVGSKNDFEQLRRMITESLSCGPTFSNNAITDPNSTSQCPGTTSSPGTNYLRLYRRSSNGTVAPLTEPVTIDGSRFGDYLIQAVCSASEQTLVVRIAKPDGAGGFKKDPVTKIPFDFNHPKSLIYGNGPSAISVCYGKTTMSIGGFVSFSGVTASSPTTPNHSYTVPGSAINVASIVESTTMSCASSLSPPRVARGHFRITWNTPFSSATYPVVITTSVCPATYLPAGGTDWGGTPPPSGVDTYGQIVSQTANYVDIKVTAGASPGGPPCQACASTIVNVLAYDSN